MESKTKVNKSTNFKSKAESIIKEETSLIKYFLFNIEGVSNFNMPKIKLVNGDEFDKLENKYFDLLPSDKYGRELDIFYFLKGIENYEILLPFKDNPNIYLLDYNNKNLKFKDKSSISSLSDVVDSSLMYYSISKKQIKGMENNKFYKDPTINTLYIDMLESENYILMDILNKSKNAHGIKFKRFYKEEYAENIKSKYNYIYQVSSFKKDKIKDIIDSDLTKYLRGIEGISDPNYRSENIADALINALLDLNENDTKKFIKLVMKLKPDGILKYLQDNFQ
jgi:hypothetical protein